MPKAKVNLQVLQKRIQTFIRERDWEQFHSPKNVSMSIAIEAAELMEHFQWANTFAESANVMQDKAKREEIEDELADIAIYVLDFCNLYGVDLEQAICRKMLKNERKYPVKVVKGRSDKYTYYQKRKAKA